MDDDELCQRLLAVLRRVTDTPLLEFAGQPVRLHGGFWADLFAFRLKGATDGWDRELVARVMPDAGLAAKETIIQAAVAAAGFPTPVVRASGGADAGLGRAYMVMDRADGSPLLGGLDRVPVAQVPRLLASIPETLAATMAELHALDPHPVADKLRGCDRAMTESEFVEGLEAAATVFHRSDLAGAARWFIDHPPPEVPDVICHGDLHPFNLLVDDTGQVTVLDWSAALIGPRAYDVAFTSLMLAEPPLLVGGALRPLLRAAGRLLSRRFVRRYRVHSGATIDRSVLAWHQAVVCLRALVEVAGWVDADTVEGRERHPWLVSGQAFARRLSKITGVRVRAR